jgi:hypothetical protein
LTNVVVVAAIAHEHPQERLDLILILKEQPQELFLVRHLMTLD